MKTTDVNHTLHTVYSTLRLTFGLVAIIAGLDKFTNLLTHWADYLNPSIANIVPVSAATLMMIVGIIEIIAGIIVLAKPRIGGYIVMAWLVCIALSLISSGRYFDVAVRDLVMAIGAYSLSNLATIAASESVRYQVLPA